MCIKTNYLLGKKRVFLISIFFNFSLNFVVSFWKPPCELLECCKVLFSNTHYFVFSIEVQFSSDISNQNGISRKYFISRKRSLFLQYQRIIEHIRIKKETLYNSDQNVENRGGVLVSFFSI